MTGVLFCILFHFLSKILSNTVIVKLIFLIFDLIDLVHQCGMLLIGYKNVEVFLLFCGMNKFVQIEFFMTCLYFL